MRKLITFCALAFPGLPAPAATICTLVAEAATGAVLVEEGDCRARVTPASTFKIALAVMGYETGLLTDAHHPVMRFQPGDPDWGGAAWRRDIDPAAWMRASVVWYSQRLTRALEAETLGRHARAYGYGNADFSGDPGQDNGLERAWVSSSLKISPHEQVAFLAALVGGALPAGAEAQDKARALVQPQPGGDWTLYGKTGAAYPRRADRSFDYAHGWGWYVGWAEAGDRVLVFARLTQAEQRTADVPGPLTRDGFLRDWPGLVAP